MKVIEDYLKKDLNRSDLTDWEEIRVAYAQRAAEFVKNDWQSPSYLASLKNQAGRRAGKIIGNINDYTRDQHDLALSYEKKFVSEYLPWIGLLPIEAFVTSSGMAALTTIVVALQRMQGVEITVMVGKHSYFQNLEILTKSFLRVVLFDETNEEEWSRMIVKKKPKAVFVDSICNESNLTVPPVVKIAEFLSRVASEITYLVVDNSMLSIGFPWKEIVKYRNRKLEVIGWESLNKYYQFGLDRTTGGIVWGAGKMRAVLFRSRLNAGTIMPDINVAMLPRPQRKILEIYLVRIEQNRRLMKSIIGDMAIVAKSNYDFSGAQLVINSRKCNSYTSIQSLIKRVIENAKIAQLQISAGTSFGMPTTRIYLTARATDYAKMFLRVSVGTEEFSEVIKIGRVIRDLV